MSTLRERILSFVPIETVPLPRPLNRFGTAFPLAVAEAYATAYAPRRGVVLDPLAHPWSAADAVETADRRGLARSREPLGEWARGVVALAPPADEILRAFDRVADSALVGTPHRVAMRELYGSRCRVCRAPVVVEAFLWERDAPLPTKKAFRCAVCAREGRALLIEPVDADDEERTRRLEPRGMAYWQLVERFGSDPASAALGESVAALYTPRNITALMAALRAIETSVSDAAAQGVLKLCLLESIVAGSRLNAVAGHGAPLRIEKGRAKRGHASQTREVNVWLEYERTVRELVSWLSRQEQRSAASRGALALDPGEADLVMCQAPVEDTLGGWSTVASALLLDAKALKPIETGEGRLASRERLLRTLRAALIDAHRASRKEAAAVVYVPHADAATIAACVLAGAGGGYRLRTILYQRDAQPGAYGAPAAAVCDFDRDLPLLRDASSADATLIEDAIRQGVRDAAIARGEPVREDVAAVAALQSLAAKGLLMPIALARAGGVSELELFLDHFKSALADGRRSGLVRVALGDDPEEVAYAAADATDVAPLDDRVEWAVWGLLSSAREIDTRALLRRVYALFRGIETPDRELVERCVAAYATQTDDGRWRIFEADALVARQASQAQVVAELVDAGHRLGFRVHVGRDVQRRALPASHALRGATLADLMTDAERGRGPGTAVRGTAEAVEFIDCVWYERSRMVFLWQVDWTARLSRSVVSLGEAIADDDRVFRFFAVPGERTALLREKLRRAPALADLVRRRGWRFVKWEPLRRFLGDAAAGLDGLEPVLGLEPAVEQAGHQLAFKW
ncbi:MAG TPA: hypothetical protein VGQ86_10245 [Candidatus Limnocylindria bacterium]|nr:hypothetical protein [Candidatus Limnocylindria bacterium]